VISQSAFAIYQEQAAKRKYSSLQYAEYEDCQMADEVYADDETLVLCDVKQTPAKLDFAANDFDQVMARISKIENPLRINFVPYECQQQMLRNGFEIWAEYVDYFNLNLMGVSVKPIALEDLDYMKRSESEQISQLSKRCAGQSRGFYGEEAGQFAKWLDDGNQIILIREKGQIVGFCCVSVYAEGTTLWVREVTVDPDFQGRGYGKQLLEQAIRYGVAKGAVKAFLAVDTSNSKAIALYRKYGFAQKDESGELQMVRH